MVTRGYSSSRDVHDLDQTQLKQAWIRAHGNPGGTVNPAPHRLLQSGLTPDPGYHGETARRWAEQGRVFTYPDGTQVRLTLVTPGQPHEHTKATTYTHTGSRTECTTCGKLLNTVEHGGLVPQHTPPSPMSSNLTAGAPIDMHLPALHRLLVPTLTPTQRTAGITIALLTMLGGAAHTYGLNLEYVMVPALVLALVLNVILWATRP